MADPLDIALGVLGVGGQILTNRTNRDIAREQMAFQERMSSTAIQRSVEDYRKAGLNPALAYERSASSPGGASTVIGDPISAGITTAQRAREARLAADTALEQQRLLRAQTMKSQADHANAIIEGRRLEQDILFRGQEQPYINRQRAVDALLSELLVPGARNQARWDEKMGMIAPAITTGAQAAQILRNMIPRIPISLEKGTVKNIILPRKPPK